MLLSEKEARAVSEKVLGEVKADDAAVTVSGEDASHLRFAANAMTTSGSRTDVSVRVTVWIAGRKGSASTNEIDDASLRALARQAEQMARVAPVDAEYVPTLGAEHYKPGQGYVDSTVNIPVAARAQAIGDILAACQRENVVGAGFHRATGTAEAGATRNGNFYFYRASQAGLSVTARLPEGAGSGYFARDYFDAAKLATGRIARESIRKALASRQPRAHDPGVYTVVLEPQAVANLVNFGLISFNARQADEGRSPFSAPGGKTRLGEKVFAERLNISSDAWHAELPASPAAQDGIPAEHIHLVRQGVLETLVYSRFWAKEKGSKPTPGPVNIIVEGATPHASVDDMIRDTRRGLLVTRFWYIRQVDPRTATYTGLTRDGVWLIENGKVQYPVNNFRFNQSLLQMLAPGNVNLIGASERAPIDADGPTGVFPALKLNEFQFTSRSDAV